MDIAEAVKDELNAGTFSVPFEAVRRYLPRLDLAAMGEALHVTVVPGGIASETAGRRQVRHDYRIDVAVQRKVAKADGATLDPLMALVEEIAEHFRGKRPAGGGAAMCIGVENVPVYSAEHLDEDGAFTSVLRLTYRVVK